VRLSQPRIAPVPQEEWSDEQAELLAPMLERGPVLNIFTTLARHPKAMQAFMSWGGYVLSRRNTLPPREREIVILRTGFVCKCGYEWTQHVRIGQHAGLSDTEITALKEGAGAEVWTEAEAALIRAADELVTDHAIGDPTWQALREHFDEKQCMDVVFTVAEYTQVSMMLNTFGVQLDEGLWLDPDLVG
jgi:alkylhydroperoxidase family enzyme